MIASPPSAPPLASRPTSFVPARTCGRVDVNAIITVLPRISDPIMTVADAESLEADDIAEAGGVITGFFFNSAQRAMIEKLTSTN